MLQSLELWNIVDNKSMTIPAHENIIAALAQSPVTGMVASASHDSSVKLWKWLEFTAIVDDGVERNSIALGDKFEMIKPIHYEFSVDLIARNVLVLM